MREKKGALRLKTCLPNHKLLKKIYSLKASRHRLDWSSLQRYSKLLTKIVGTRLETNRSTVPTKVKRDILLLVCAGCEPSPAIGYTVRKIILLSYFLGGILAFNKAHLWKVLKDFLHKVKLRAELYLFLFLPRKMASYWIAPSLLGHCPHWSRLLGVCGHT